MRRQTFPEDIDNRALHRKQVHEPHILWTKLILEKFLKEKRGKDT